MYLTAHGFFGYYTVPDKQVLIELKQSGPLMTIIVGILCKNGFAIASDSQAQSYRGVETKRMDYLKIHELSGENNSCLIAVGAGTVAFITKAIDGLRDKLRKEKLSSMREVAEEAENVMTDLERRYSVEKHEKLGLAKSRSQSARRSQDRILQDRIPHFAVMIGGQLADDKEPSIYIVGMDGVAERAEKFDSLGSGSAYAEYLLAKYYREGMSVEKGTKLAVYIIEEVKKIDPNCGGATQAVSVDGCKLRRWAAQEVSELVSKIESKEKNLIDAWWHEVEGV